MRDIKARPLILLLGAAGSGKSAVAIELEKRYSLKQCSSYTTREPRFKDEPGHRFVEYEFMLQMMMDHMLVASTMVDGHLYGATQSMVDDADIYVIDPRGAIELHEMYASERPIYYVYLYAPEDELEHRLTDRGTKDDIERRKQHNQEIQDQAYYAGSLYEFSLYKENRDFDECVDAVAKFVGLE